MTEVDALTAFIRARLDEEDRDAKAAKTTDWKRWSLDDDLAPEYAVEALHNRSPGLALNVCRDVTQTVGQHIARQDPAATLARVAALRALVERLPDEATGLDEAVDMEFRTGQDGIRDEATEPYLGEVLLRHVAAIWRDHPDYQPEWVTSG